VAVIVAILLAACGGDGDEGTMPSPPREGVVSPRSASFQKYSGKGAAQLHIAEFGVEASDEDRTRAEATILAYLRATEKGDWDAACAYVSATLRAQIDEIARRSAASAGEPECGEILKVLGEGVKASPVDAPNGISSLRVKEGPGGGFALFHGGDGSDYWMTVKREQGDWKVLSAAPQRFG